MQDDDDDYDSANVMVNEWPEVLPQIKLPNAWPNIYQNKSQLQTVQEKSSDFKEAYLTWRHRAADSDDGLGSEDSSSRFYNQLHKSADKRKGIKNGDRLYRKKRIMNNKYTASGVSNGDGAKRSDADVKVADTTHMRLQQKPLKSFNEKSRKMPRMHGDELKG